MFLGIIAPLFNSTSFIILSSLSALLFSITGVAAGATKGALTKHFAIQDNMAGFSFFSFQKIVYNNHLDVSAKDASQETVVSLFGTLVRRFRFVLSIYITTL